MSATVLRDIYYTRTGKTLLLEDLVEDAKANKSDMQAFYESDLYKRALSEAADALAKLSTDLNRETHESVKSINKQTVKMMDRFKQSVSVNNQQDMVQQVIDRFFTTLETLLIEKT